MNKYIMIPYTLSCLLPSSSYTENENVTTCFLMCKNRDELLNEIITDIIEYMYEFCSKEYGYDIEITSYDNFCEKWWNLQECKMGNFYIFEIHYFDNNIWNELKIKDYRDELYTEYVKYVHAKEKNAYEMGTNEMGTNEMGTNEMGTNEMGTNEMGTK